MNAFNTSWTSALSMTLLHSLWQGLAITLLAAFILKAFAVRTSSVKYLIKTAAFFLLFACSLVTFFILSQTANQITEPIALNNFAIHIATPVVETTSYTDQLIAFLQMHQSWIVLGWAIGAFLFSLRFAAGIAYVKYLRGGAQPADEEWSETLKELASKLGIQRVVELYESILVQTPLTIGYLKPIVLMPIGLMAGLSTQQVEVILIHELEHIRRHDYLINFIQSLGETILFFNPFVWILSAWIREERENCCDDAVLREGYDPKLYATTLVELESARLQHTGLALALTGNKNQLLNRIKRIMEHSAKNQKGKEKFIPVVLLVLGLVFASWLSINPKDIANDTSIVKVISNNDTIKNPTTKVETYSRKSITTYDANGKPHEEVIETYNGGEDEFDFTMPGVPSAPDIADMADMNFDFGMAAPFAIGFDTLPDMTGFRFDMNMNEEQMRGFEKMFKEEFQKKFGDFYSKNQVEMEKMMADMHEKMAKMEEHIAFVPAMPPYPAHEMEQAKLAQLQAEEAMHQADLHMKINEDQMRRNEEVMKMNEEIMHRHEADMKVMEEKMQKFEKELTEMLTKDGYLKKGTKLNGVNFNFTESGITVNGEKIKASDEKKYRELNHKYFGETVRHRPE